MDFPYNFTTIRHNRFENFVYWSIYFITPRPENINIDDKFCLAIFIHFASCFLKSRLNVHLIYYCYFWKNGSASYNFFVVFFVQNVTLPILNFIPIS